MAVSKKKTKKTKKPKKPVTMPKPKKKKPFKVPSSILCDGGK